MGLIDVKYKGLSDVRTITKKNWEQEGVGVPVDTTWDASNRWTLRIDATDRMVEVLKAQGHFQVSEVTDDGSRKVLFEASEPDREPDIVVDGATGQRSENKRKGPEALAPEPTDPSGSDTTGTKGKGRSTSGDA